MFRLLSVLVLTALAAGCVHVRTDPIEVEPIHITVDVYVKVDRELDNIFRDIDAASETFEEPRNEEVETDDETTVPNQ